MDIEPVFIEPLWDDHENQYVTGSCGARWKVSDLLARAKDLPVFDLPLIHIDLHAHSFDCGDLVEFAQHMAIVAKANLRHPIIMDHKGDILDGRHRIVKALLEKKPTIKAKRFMKYVTPTFQPS